MITAQSRTRRWSFEWARKVRDVVTSPFTRAPSLESYSDSGYVLLLILLLGVTIILWKTDVLTGPLANPSPLVRLLLEFVGGRFHLGPSESVLAIPVLAWPTLLWGLGLYRPVRRWVGEKTANLLFWVLDRLIAVGEWCLEHRWWSLVLIMLLVFAFAAGFSSYLTVRAQTQDLKRDYESWFQQAEHLLLESSMTHPETSRFWQSESYWHKDFDLLFPKTHPANCLHELYQLLFAQGTDESWAKTIRHKGVSIDKLADRCRTMGMASDSMHSKQAQALIDLARAKLLVRLAKFDHDPQNLVVAFERFEELNQTDLYRSAVANGMGTVYANAFSAHLGWKAKNQTAPTSQLVHKICATPYDCVVNAHKAYAEAAKDRAKCSFESRRLDNNETDFSIRLAFDYEKVLKDVPPSSLESWLNSRQALVDHLRQGITQLDSCNGQEPVLNVTLVTTAQAYGAIMKLLHEDQLPFQEDAAQAGHFLRLAYTFERNNYQDWSLEYFCTAYSAPDPERQFLQELRSTAPPTMGPVEEELRRKCQLTH